MAAVLGHEIGHVTARTGAQAKYHSNPLSWAPTVIKHPGLSIRPATGVQYAVSRRWVPRLWPGSRAGGPMAWWRSIWPGTGVRPDSVLMS